MGEDNEVLRFSEKIDEVMEKFREAINLIGSSGVLDKMIKSCFDAYQKALDGDKRAGKFCRKWKQIISTKVGVLDLINLPSVG